MTFGMKHMVITGRRKTGIKDARHQVLRTYKDKNLGLSEFSKIFNHVEKLHTILRVENFAFDGPLVNFYCSEKLAIFGRFVNQQISDAMKSNHFAKREKVATNWRTCELST